ncbi:hypothetical protein ACM9HF_03030 [Colwellia sp. RE-S-Sl-9]
MVKLFVLLNSVLLCLSAFTVLATDSKTIKISDVISKEEFSLYKDVGEFIDHSPKVTIIVQPELTDVAEYGEGVVKSLTGTDCDRDGKMDDNATCNAVYLKLWLKYKR